ncbi:MAG: adenylate/guanylate cyclase domain-containing protein [Paracoccaceae bacterium]
MATGLVLFVFALTHFLNIGLGLISSRVMEEAQEWRKLITRSALGEIIIIGSLLAHGGLALFKLAQKRTLRMPVWEWVQIILGILIPIQLIAHIVFTHVAADAYGVNDKFGYLIGLIWGTNDAWFQSLLLLVVWVHGCVGLHFWLKATQWWRRNFPTLVSFASLVPAFALAGFLTEGRRVGERFDDAETHFSYLDYYSAPDADAFSQLDQISQNVDLAYYVCLALVAGFFIIRKLVSGRKSVRIRYVNGPEISSQKGLTLLEMSRAAGVPHTSLCGGKGRCTTCRVVIEEGADLLHPPGDVESRSLQAVNASPSTRLACQIRPTDPATVFRVFRPDGRRSRAHASQGSEKRLAILFLDMRSFTARTTGQLPYDVVFLLNRFFDAIVPSITKAGGKVDKYLGDGLLAVFETDDESSSAQSALRAAVGISTALETFNKTLEDEGQSPVKIGIGLHLGDVVLGEIGAAGNAPRTLIGDSVNAASRLEGQTKELGVELLVSEPLLISAGVDTSDLELVTLELRGVSDPLPALAVKSGRTLTDILPEVLSQNRQAAE